MGLGLLNKMKNEINKSGGSKAKILYIKDGSKKRVRFLVDFEEGFEFVFHDNFEAGINSICQEELGKDCPYCEQAGLRTRKNYCWPVWDYDEKEIKLFLFAANNCTPVPALIGLFETYDTIIDRDFVIGRAGTQQKTTYSVVPMDKAKFKTSVKVPDKKAILKILEKAFPCEDADIEDEEETPKKKKKSTSAPEKKKKKPEPELEEDEDEEDEEAEDDEECDYDEMSPKELYALCVKRKIKCKPKKRSDYYMELLEAADEEEEGEADEDEWEDD